MEESKEYKISDLSSHLFWEYDISQLGWEKDKKLIIQRVIELGIGDDWEMIKGQYGLNRIINIAKSIRTLDEISANYLAVISNSDISEFSCYTQRQSIPHYSGY